MHNLTGFSFQVDAVAPGGAARAGTFTTPHGAVSTPVFMPVGTLGTVKALDPDDLVGAGAGGAVGCMHLERKTGVRPHSDPTLTPL